MAQNQRLISQKKKYHGLNISLSSLTAQAGVDKNFCFLGLFLVCLGLLGGLFFFF